MGEKNENKTLAEAIREGFARHEAAEQAQGPHSTEQTQGFHGLHLLVYSITRRFVKNADRE